MTLSAIPPAPRVNLNNLYGESQSSRVPIGGYRWMTPAEYDSRDWMVYDGESTDIGHILEVDLDYSDRELHLEHSSLPLAPHKLDIDETMLSPFASRLLNEARDRKQRGAERHRSTKLVATFQPRERYIVHSRNLALYLQLGMKLTRIHRAIEFRTSSFLKEYITFCTNKRKEAKSEFRKHIFKTFSNSVFGEQRAPYRRDDEPHLYHFHRRQVHREHARAHGVQAGQDAAADEEVGELP